MVIKEPHERTDGPRRWRGRRELSSGSGRRIPSHEAIRAEFGRAGWPGAEHLLPGRRVTGRRVSGGDARLGCVDNPFRYGDIVEGQYFTNRFQELAELKGDLQSGQNVIVISPRRFGKSSLVKRALREVRSSVLSTYIDLGEVSTKQRLVEVMAQRMHEDLETRSAAARRKLADVIRSLHPNLRYTVDDTGARWSLHPTVGKAGAKDVDDALAALLTLPATVARQRGKRVALVLDEFQECVEIDENLPRVMRSIFQHQGDVCHVFLGSKQHLMKRVFNDKNQPMYRIGKVMPLNLIERKEWQKFLPERCRATAVEVQSEAVETLLDLSECLPYETQQLAHFAWNIAFPRDRLMNEGVVWEAWARVLAAENIRYRDIWAATGLTSTAKGILRAVAAGVRGGFYSTEVALQWQLGSHAATTRALEALLEAEHLADDQLPGTRSRERSFRIPDPIFRAWIRNQT